MIAHFTKRVATVSYQSYKARPGRGSNRGYYWLKKFPLVNAALSFDHSASVGPYIEKSFEIHPSIILIAYKMISRQFDRALHRTFTTFVRKLTLPSSKTTISTDTDVKKTLK